MDILTDLQKHASYAGILTDGTAFPVCDSIVFHDPFQNIPSLRPIFLSITMADAFPDILR
jgi:hypothetical protein